jgi:hypothetical protein
MTDFENLDLLEMENLNSENETVSTASSNLGSGQRTGDRYSGTYDTRNGVNAYNSLDNCLNDSVYSFQCLLQDHNQPPKKRLKVAEEPVPIVFGLLNTRMGKAKVATIKILLDSGASLTCKME